MFYSEDEAAPGDELQRNPQARPRPRPHPGGDRHRGMLQRPGWVKTEVETFRALHPDRPIIPISIDGALTDPVSFPPSAAIPVATPSA